MPDKKETIMEERKELPVWAKRTIYGLVAITGLGTAFRLGKRSGRNEVLKEAGALPDGTK